ncbi:hypothetical protein [Bradyrhizobium yuanmingense]|uniref:hypothetical protein n=1 Tax=Bradyrhizobium yuanmingense TaxID=108015 RepID=UPI0023B8F330|nr:hypothetical protein [Bradyrhizobium yuanmingense]MDF0581268.1 hypothetical protein [Bradyrhizobium yuanmingense]
MFNQPIVLVVGAGASFDVYGLPLGGRLASTIAADTDFFWDSYHDLAGPSRGSSDLFNSVFRRKFPAQNGRLQEYVTAAQMLSAAISSTISIDDALYQLSDFPKCVEVGKMCIMRYILAAERKSTIKIDPDTGTIDPKAGREGWIEQIFSMAITGYKLKDIKHAFERITFVNFNYDRCIEHYLYHALQRIGISTEDAGGIVSKLNIIRPYGGLGSIVPGQKDHLSFGGGATTDLFTMLGRIRTFTESEVLHDKHELSKALSSASLIMFLGFGFHAQNLELLALTKPHSVRDLKVLATTFAVHEANIPELKLAIGRTCRTDPERVETFHMTASEMLTKLRMKINLALG